MADQLSVQLPAPCELRAFSRGLQAPDPAEFLSHSHNRVRKSHASRPAAAVKTAVGWSAGWRGPGRPRSSGGNAGGDGRDAEAVAEALRAGLGPSMPTSDMIRGILRWAVACDQGKMDFPAGFITGVERSAWTSLRARSNSGGAETSRQRAARHFGVQIRVEATSRKRWHSSAARYLRPQASTSWSLPGVL